MVTSVFLLASWLGCMIIASFGLKLGRRTWIIAGNVIEILGTIISATSYSYGQLSKCNYTRGDSGADRYHSRGPIDYCTPFKNAQKTKTDDHRALEMAFSLPVSRQPLD